MSRKNIKFKKPTFVLSPLALLTLAACGGGGGGGQSGGGGGSFSVGGHIVKGPLSNALVGLDYDGDGIVDSSTVRTGSDGSFTISTSNSNYTIIAVTDETTVDTSSGSVLAGATLKAPAGATVVTPTTTLMEEAGLTAAQVAAVLDLPDGVDPLSFNPYAAGVDPDKALAVEQAGQQIMSAVTAFAAAAEGAGASKADAFEAALTAVADVVKDKATKVNDPNASAADKSLDLTSTADLALIKDKVVAEVSTTSGVNTAAFNALADDAATAVKNVNDEIATVTDLTSDAAKDVFSTVQVLTDQVKTAAAAEVNNAGSGSISFTDTNVVNAAAKNKAPTDITLTSSSISEGASSLVVGTLKTTDSDQSDGVAFTYEIAEISGTDYGAFSINQSTGELSLKDQPDYETKTSYSINIVSTDEFGKTYSKSFSISVTDINEAPTLTVPAGGSVTEDASTFTITGSLSGTDPENASLTYSVVGSSATNGSFSVTGTYGTLALNAATGAYTYSLDNAKTATNALKASDSKIESFSVQVTDGVNTTTAQTLSFTIQGANDAPTVVNPIVDTTATEGINYVWQIDENVFADVDAGDSLTYTASLEDGSDLPAWLTFNAETLTAFGTPPNSAVGVLVGKLTAKDTSGATASDIVSLTVVNTNDAPTVANAISDQTIAEDSAFSFQFASDVFVDVDAGDSLTYTAALSNDAALPSWLAFDAATRTFSGTPLNANVGVIAVKVTATDSGNAAITDTFNITVTNTNDAPTVVNPMIDGTATEGVSYVWQFNENIFSDVDVGDSLTYTATLEDGSDLPSWLTFDADTLTASGTPPNSAVGVIVGKLTATDTSGASVSDVVALTVSNTNDAPTVANAIADQTIAEDSALSFQFASDAFADVDVGDSFTYTATLSDGSALPSWLSFNGDTRTFSGTPANADVGSIDIKVTATDGSAASVSDTFALAVTAAAVSVDGLAGSQSENFIVSEGSNEISFSGAATGSIVMVLDSSGSATFSRGGISGKDSSAIDALVVTINDIGNKTIGGEVELTVVVSENATSGADEFVINAPDASKIALRGSMGGGADSIVIKVADDNVGTVDSRDLILDTSGLTVASNDRLVFDFEGEEDLVNLTLGSDVSQFSDIEVAKGTLDVRSIIIKDGLQLTVNSGISMSLGQFLSVDSVISSSGHGEIEVILASLESIQDLNDQLDPNFINNGADIKFNASDGVSVLDAINFQENNYQEILTNAADVALM